MNDYVFIYKRRKLLVWGLPICIKREWSAYWQKITKLDFLTGWIPNYNYAFVNESSILYQIKLHTRKNAITRKADVRKVYYTVFFTIWLLQLSISVFSFLCIRIWKIFYVGTWLSENVINYWIGTQNLFSFSWGFLIELHQVVWGGRKKV